MIWDISDDISWFSDDFDSFDDNFDSSDNLTAESRDFNNSNRLFIL